MRHFVLALCLLSALPAWADKPEIEKIRQIYQQIHSSLPRLKVNEFESDLKSTEGLQALKYQDAQQQIKLIKVTAFGEMGKQTNAYYYHNQQVVFVLSTEERYNVPFYMTKESAEANGTEPFDPKKSTFAENRYYFKQGQLIRWLNEQKQAVKMDNPRFKQRGRELFAASQSLLKKAQP